MTDAPTDEPNNNPQFTAEVRLIITVAGTTQEEANDIAAKLESDLRAIKGWRKEPATLDNVASAIATPMDVYIVLEEDSVAAVRPTLAKARESMAALLDGYCDPSSDEAKHVLEYIESIDEMTVLTGNACSRFPGSYEVRIVKTSIIP